MGGIIERLQSRAQQRNYQVWIRGTPPNWWPSDWFPSHDEIDSFTITGTLKGKLKSSPIEKYCLSRGAGHKCNQAKM